MLPGDILLHENTSNDLISKLMRWGIGKFTHASMFAGIQTDPAGKDDYYIFESIGVGPTLTPLSAVVGKNVILIKMPLSYRDRIMLAAKARMIADNPCYQYGYDDMLLSAIPDAICRKLGIPIRWIYRTKHTQICSKAVELVYFQSGIREKLPEYVSLPKDLVYSPGAAIYGGKVGEQVLW